MEKQKVTSFDTFHAIFSQRKDGEQNSEDWEVKSRQNFEQNISSLVLLSLRDSKQGHMEEVFHEVNDATDHRRKSYITLRTLSEDKQEFDFEDFHHDQDKAISQFKMRTVSGDSGFHGSIEDLGEHHLTTAVEKNDTNTKVSNSNDNISFQNIQDSDEDKFIQVLKSLSLKQEELAASLQADDDSSESSDCSSDMSDIDWRGLKENPSFALENTLLKDLAVLDFTDRITHHNGGESENVDDTELRSTTDCFYSPPKITSKRFHGEDKIAVPSPTKTIVVRDTKFGFKVEQVTEL